MNLDEIRRQLEILSECQDAYVAELRARVEKLERQVAELEHQIDMMLDREPY